MSRVRLHISAFVSSGDDRVEINGHDLAKAIRSVHYDAGPPGDVSRLTLDLVVREWVDVDGEARVDILDKTREALIALGWTPPKEDR